MTQVWKFEHSSNTILREGKEIIKGNFPELKKHWQNDDPVPPGCPQPLEINFLFLYFFHHFSGM